MGRFITKFKEREYRVALDTLKYMKVTGEKIIIYPKCRSIFSALTNSREESLSKRVTLACNENKLRKNLLASGVAETMLDKSNKYISMNDILKDLISIIEHIHSSKETLELRQFEGAIEALVEFGYDNLERFINDYSQVFIIQEVSDSSIKEELSWRNLDRDKHEGEYLVITEDNNVRLEII